MNDPDNKTFMSDEAWELLKEKNELALRLHMSEQYLKSRGALRKPVQEFSLILLQHKTLQLLYRVICMRLKASKTGLYERGDDLPEETPDIDIKEPIKG